jgi:AcrR family transcriptional regulator
VPKRSPGKSGEQTTETKDVIIRAALQAVRELGFAGATARAIARIGGFNQALIFYHFGSVDRVLLAALDATSTSRMERYRGSIEGSRSLDELIQVARRNYREDLESGHMTVVAEIVAGGVADPMLRTEIATRMHSWVDFVEVVLDRFLRDSPLSGFVRTRDIAFAIVAFYVGINILSRTGDDGNWVDGLFDAAEGVSPLLVPLLASQPSD